jgi:hypothetical protein
MPQCNNDIALYYRPIPDCSWGNERGWVFNQLPPTILAYFNVLAVPITPIPLQIYMICTLDSPWPVGIAVNTMALVYGTKPLLSFIQETSTLTIPQTF